MTYTRDIKLWSYGEDVLEIKRLLLALGCYASGVSTVSSKRFGRDTLRAVKVFQASHADADGKQLTVDGIVGRLTFAAILLASGTTTPAPSEVSGHLSAAHRSAIEAALAGASSPRRALVLDAISFAADKDAIVRPAPYSIYRRGGNLYNKDLTVNTISVSQMESYISNASYKQYTEGREEMLRLAASLGCTGADCSGGVAGLLRHQGLVTSGFDATANTLLSDKYSNAVQKDALKPGDFVGKSGHIGIYVGAGYVVEWAGGSYGCQLTTVDKRTLYDYTSGKLRTLSAWTIYRRPLAYKEAADA